jgi:hypothetical protein
MKRITTILINAVPIVLMVGLIPFVQNDIVLSLLYLIIIAFSLAIKREDKDFILFVFGFFALFASEYFFIATGVETFTRHSLLGVMPDWLPILWGYGFIVMRRGIVALI